MKLQLVMLPDYKSVFVADYLEPLVTEYFDLRSYDSRVSYDKKSTLFVTHLSSDIFLANQLYNDGFKLVCEELWEYPRDHDLWYTMKSPRWFWINECLWLHQTGNQNYKVNKTFRKLALMPIGRKKPFRDHVLEKLKPYLSDFIWSYNVKSKDHGHCLPGDCDHFTSKNIEWQRFFNPAWYNDTHFTVVVETMTDGFFITEKTFKPLSYKHPFLVIGTAGTLNALKSWGFETFDNLFDETYDQLYIFDQRLDLAIKNIKNYKKDFYSPLTLEKLEHNSHHFWDLPRVRSLFYTDIVEPLLHYANRET